MKIEELMTKEVGTCFADDSLAQAAKQMWERDCGCIPIVDYDQRVIGMLTDRDICMAAYTQGEALWRLRCADAMSKSVHAIGRNDPIEAAEKVMQANRVRRLPVVDGDGKLVGLLSLNDLARASQLPKGPKPLAVETTFAAVCRRPGVTP
jgi:CBS domain-containing protein